MRNLLLGLALGLTLATAAPIGAGSGSMFDNSRDIERQNADAERYQQEMFRQDQRNRWDLENRQRFQDQMLRRPC